MANFQVNRLMKHKQFRNLMIAGSCLVGVVALILVLLIDGNPKRKGVASQSVDLTGIVNESFTEANAESALTAQQTELESLKNQISELAKSIKTMSEDNAKVLQTQASNFQKQISMLNQLNQEKATLAVQAESIPPELKEVRNPQLWHGDNPGAELIKDSNAWKASSLAQLGRTTSGIHVVSFRPKKHIRRSYYLNPAHYVPSNTSVRAVILGGADADASVNGQSKNNGVMLFKFLEDGTLPNGQRSRLRGCRVSSNSYGDISSERAFATLYRLSCAQPGQPIIDKEVTGWVFFNGKVGIKGKPLMRDNKVMQWAGISGALSGIASAAQYAQSVQQFGTFGNSSFVPSGNIAPYAAYGGASKAADTLSQYYVKRAEQYHPVIQVGAGNVVTVVFKDGFYLEPEEDPHRNAKNRSEVSNRASIATQDSPEEMNFTVPPEVLGRIENANSLSQNNTGVNP